MSKLIMRFLLDFLEGLTSITNSSLLILAEQPFAIEKEMVNFGFAQFNSIFTMFTSIGITLIVVKFLKKGFEMYVLWTDGDADVDPAQLVINFVRAMVIALTFTFLYKWFTELIIDILDDVLSSVGLYENINNPYDENIINQILNGATLTITSVIGYVIFFIILFILELKLIGIGFEMLILRIGFPLACVGLMDADKGVFKTYIQKLFQVSITIMVQITIAKLALSFLIAGHLIWGLAAAYFAVTSPKFIKEFLIFTSGGGLVNNLYSGARLVQMARTIIR